MKINFLFTTLLLLVMSSHSAWGVVQSNSTAEKQVVSKTHQKINKKEARKNYRKAFKSARKATKVKPAKPFKNSKFRIGLAVLGFGIGSSLIGWLLGVGFVGVLGVIGLVVGVLFLIWGLLESIA